MLCCRDKNIEAALDAYIKALTDKHEYAYSLGYFESFMVNVLTAFVPAMDRAQMLDYIKQNIEIINKETIIGE